MSLNGMILCDKLKNGLCKIVTKLIVTKLKLHCSLWVGWLASQSQIEDCWHEVILRKSAYLQGFWSKSEALLYSCQAACHPEPSRPPYSTNNKGTRKLVKIYFQHSTLFLSNRMLWIRDGRGISLALMLICRSQLGSLHYESLICLSNKSLNVAHMAYGIQFRQLFFVHTITFQKSHLW